MSETRPTTTESNWGNRSGIAATAKYNPHLWSADELRAIFVARQRELETMLQVLKTASPTSAPQHLLITGQRGMGKSTLLQRVALAVEDVPDLRAIWLPLRFPEEQYTVSTPAELWTNVIGALADAQERLGKPTLEIDTELAQLAHLPAGDREEASLNWIHQWCETHKKRLLLLMDSTDLLFANLAGGEANKRSGKQDGGASALWRVRKALLHSPHLLWLGGSYKPLEANGLYSDAFLDFFQLIELRPLTLVEMQTAIQAMARVFGAGRGLQGDDAEAEVKRLLGARPERLRAMRQLTGGNPRTTVMLYELFAAGGRDSIRADLERLIDAMTPLYKARLEVLADQPRKVFAHVMEHWAPISANALAQAAHLSVGTVSTQLTRLEQEGLVEKTALGGTKRLGFQASERFFNIWYLMRNAPRGARSRVGSLVAFMQLWYSKDELQGLARARWNEHRDGMNCDGPELEYSRAIARAMPKDILDRSEEAEAAYRKAIERDRINPFPVANLARLLALTKRDDEASELYREALKLAHIDDDNLRLQAHCWLGNADLAMQALDALAGHASGSSGRAFSELKEQCFECHAIGLAKPLAKLMERSRFADFLQPFALALRAASGDRDALLDVAVEVRGIAEELLQQINGLR
jgi:tetratricopeptide (TPR) repeat protein